jgi:hypothetical protein
MAHKHEIYQSAAAAAHKRQAFSPMNDTRTGQLTSQWTIPTFARTHLWLETESGCVQTEGPHGLFNLPAPAEHLILRWGGEQGSVLASLRWHADSLDWNGQVRLGGMVEAVHMMSVPNLEMGLAILVIEGQPLKPAASAYPTPAQRMQLPYRLPDFFTGIEADIDPTVTTWLVPEDSGLLAMAQDAMSNNLRLYIQGTLNAGWRDFAAIPLSLEAVTLFPR